MKRNNKKGFTLAELLIVVAIIAVLTAIAIPVFGAQLEKSKQSTDAANLRAAYAEASSKALDNENGIGTADSVEMKSAVWTKMPADSKIGPVPVNSITGKDVGSSMTVTVNINDGDNGTVKFGSNTFDADTGLPKS